MLPVFTLLAALSAPAPVAASPDSLAQSTPRRWSWYAGPTVGLALPLSWKVLVAVVEVPRIPETTDILALYEVMTDEDGDLESYRRLRRYARGVPGED